METTGKAYRVLAICDDESTCGFCGREDLQRVVAFEEVETGEVLYAGTTCAQTVKLLVVDEETGESKPRTARQILTIAERAVRETKIAELLAAADWLAAYLIVSYRAELECCPRPVDVSHYTSSKFAQGLLIPVPMGRANREFAIVRVARDWAMFRGKIDAAKTMAKRETLARDFNGHLEGLRLKFAGTFGSAS